MDRSRRCESSCAFGKDAIGVVTLQPWSWPFPPERVSVVIVPVVVRRPFVAAQALGIRPLAPTARTDASGIERVPGVEAGTHPKVVRTGFPATTWTANAVATGTVTGGLSGSWNTYTIRLALQQQVALDHVAAANMAVHPRNGGRSEVRGEEGWRTGERRRITTPSCATARLKYGRHEQAPYLPRLVGQAGEAP